MAQQGADARAERGGADGRTFARLFAASTLSMMVALLFNGRASEAIAALNPWARDWATGISIVAFVGLTALARTRPSLVRPGAFCAGTAVLTVAGHALSAWGVWAGSAAAATWGLCAANVAGAWVAVLWLLACSELSLPQACTCLAGASGAGILAGGLIRELGTWQASLAVDTLCCLAILALCMPAARPFFARLAAAGLPSDLEVAHPSAFLPLRSRLFVFIFAFSMTYGFGLRCATGGSTALQDALGALLMGALAAYAALSRRQVRMDAIFVASLALVTFGYLAVLVDDPRVSGAAPALLVVGSVTFELLMWFALAAAARRNAVDAIPTVAWGMGVDYAGIIAGALLAALVGADAPGADALPARMLVAALLGAISLFSVCTRRTFSFDETIEGIAPDAPVVQAVEVRDVDVLEARVARVAEECALTPRERDVMAQLARGNNARHIEEELSISHNTVKYHARNVYAKLGVHSQQELIDLVAQR